LAALCAGLALAACARGEPPAPVVYGKGTSGSHVATRPGVPPRPPDRPERLQRPDGSGQVERGGESAGTPADRVHWARSGRAGIHTVKRGETVYELARRYRVPIRAIIEANDLSPPYTLYVGQELRIPVPRRHVVETGDTVYDISRAYGVDMSQLTRLNDIAPPYTIRPGQVLVIPGRGSETRTARRSAPAAPTRGEAATSPADGASGADPDRADRPADRRTASLPLPPEPPARKAADPPARDHSADRRASQRSAQTGASADARQTAQAPQPKSIPQPPPRAERRFLWPLNGRILTGFGPQEGGLHNDGINIAAPAGTPVRAAENGVVAYVGNELRGFGNLLLIKHADDWVTAYAHTREVLVDHGQKVRRGQIVARVGQTGSVSRPQLHFEVRKGSKAKDPQKLLGAQQAAR
jgi:murein DD-endopeptidase MepM/ murein hydrolase activator NlpD